MAGLQETPKGVRLHIGIFGRRNAGKSSIINRLTKQNLALVSDVAGTTTDPVYKAMEILPIGPVMIIDTAGIDDEGDLGKLRIEKTKEVIGKTDVAIIVLDAKENFSPFERELLTAFKDQKTPALIALNQIDTYPDWKQKVSQVEQESGCVVIPVSSKENTGFDELRQEIVKIQPKSTEVPLLADLVKPGDTIVFCVPIDTAAPKGRLILPQVQAIRDTLDAGALALVAKENEVANLINNLKTPPALVVTDSQVFKTADEAVPKNIPLTSFSILMARQKGDLKALSEGANAIENLKPGDHVLIAEACTHVCQAEDIGRVKIPKLLQKSVGGPLHFTWYTGDSFPDDVSPYKLVIHCGACMINRKAMLWRIKTTHKQSVPIVNYGVILAKLKGVLPRALSPFKKVLMK